MKGKFIQMGWMGIASFSRQAYCVLRGLIEIVLPDGRPAGGSCCVNSAKEKMDVVMSKLLVESLVSGSFSSKTPPPSVEFVWNALCQEEHN